MSCDICSSERATFTIDGLVVGLLCFQAMLDHDAGYFDEEERIEMMREFQLSERLYTNGMKMHPRW